MTYQNEIKAGMTGGLVMSLLSIPYQNLLHTAVCAAVGATISYIVTVLLKRIRGDND